jgi:hypothetical protein
MAVNHLFAASSDDVKAKKLFENSKQKLSLKNVSMDLDLEILDKKGNLKSKSLSVAFAEFNQEKKVMIEITAPEKVKGTKILTTNYLDKKGIIEIYMPATGKIQKFRANNRNLKLMGSEIPITQFSSIVDSDYSFSLLENSELSGIICHKIRVDKPDDNEYGIAYISVKDGYLLRVEKYDSKDQLQSLTELSDYIKVKNSEGKFYPKLIQVSNFKSGKSSNMKVRSLKYIQNVNTANFQITNLN